MSAAAARTRWVIAGGGTGGHVTPALALGQAARAAGDDCLFIGAERGLERRLVPEAGFELLTLGARPLVGRSPGERVAALAALGTSTLRAARALREFRADLVLSVGGYAAVPVTLAAVLLRRPLALLEANARPGAANRLVARRARVLFVEFEAAGRALTGRAADARVRVTGLPLRRELVAAFAGAPPPRAPTPPFRIFVFGGSQGARQINDAVLALLPRLDPARFSFVHQTGESDRERVAAGYAAAGVRGTVVAFERDMASRYRDADLVVCRAGAMTLAELALAGRAALLVPLTHTGGGEQLENARERERAGAAEVIDPARDTGEALLESLEKLVADPARLLAMGAAAARLARPDAAERILAECRALLAGPREGRR
ncbi:MAG TPA: undecaprenyldiphospho-muramoylpentapeptide beta-N-acetylglucosaminyltransferase [Myxococcota bacterium]|nr:undecaprenyldiphospho-muramoylpentapeptide beta-N-acetylglucosaminyltransferase [Myxococcota bacterium]